MKIARKKTKENEDYETQEKISLAGSFQNCKPYFNYQMVNKKKGRELLVHVNQLKKYGDQKAWNLLNQTCTMENTRRKTKESLEKEDSIMTQEPMLTVEVHKPLGLQEPLALQETQEGVEAGHGVALNQWTVIHSSMEMGMLLDT
jgi:hypothetical protein